MGNRKLVFISSVLMLFAAGTGAEASTTIVDASDGLCLADGGYSTALYDQPIQWKCDGGSDNNFELSRHSDGSYSMKNDASGLCLDVLSWSTSAGGEIDQYTCNGAANQNFALAEVSSGVYTIKSKSSGLCLSVNGSTSNGARLVQEECGGASQSFKMTVSGSAPTPSPSPSPTPSPSATLIPSNATIVSEVQAQSNWIFKDDPATSGGASGSSHDQVTKPSYDNKSLAREYYTTFKSNGGELYSVNFGNDKTSTHFVYETELYLVNPAANANIEMDLNQVMSNGKTVIFGVQCSGWDNSWDYTTYNTSTGHPKWNKSNLTCDPRKWSANTWHHIQIASHRDSNGVVTYDWISLDGAKQNFANAVGNSAFSLGWSLGSLILNFQIDGYGTGTSTVYTDQMKTYRW